MRQCDSFRVDSWQARKGLGLSILILADRRRYFY